MKWLLNTCDTMSFFKKYIYKIILVSLLGVVVSFLMLYQPKYIGDILTNYSKISKETLIYFFVITILLFITSSLKIFFSKSIAEGVAFDLREKVFGKMLYTSLEKLSDKRNGELISILTNDINLIRDSIGADFFDIFEGIILLSGSIYFLIVINYRLFIYTLLLFTIIIIFSFISSNILKKVVLKQQKKLSDYIDFTEKILKKIVIIKSFWLIDKVSFVSLGLSEDIYKIGLKNAKVKSIVTAINSLIFQFGIIIIVLLAGLDVNNGKMNLSELAQFVIYSTFLVTPIAILSNFIVSFNIILAAKERIFNIYDELDFYDNSANTIKKSQVENINIIEVRDISFGYKGSNVFNNFNVTFLKNNINLIEGKSGIGKTTLIRLLLNLYKVDSGKILIKGVDLYDYSPKYLRTKLISYVPQEATEWGETIYESITLGEDYDIEYINLLLNKLNLTECIFSLDNGLYTKIGTIMSKLSSGELQRLSILRGIIRDSEILILDEPTANLDSENEKIVNELLKEISKEKTIILISHKEISRNIADNIVELKERGINNA